LDKTQQVPKKPMLSDDEKERLRLELDAALTRDYNAWLRKDRLEKEMLAGVFHPGERVCYPLPLTLEIPSCKTPVTMSLGLAKHYADKLTKRGHWIATVYWNDAPEKCSIKLWNAPGWICFLKKNETAVCITVLSLIIALLITGAVLLLLPAS
jgi:hypothetical protein